MNHTPMWVRTYDNLNSLADVFDLVIPATTSIDAYATEHVNRIRELETYMQWSTSQNNLRSALETLQ